MSAVTVDLASLLKPVAELVDKLHLSGEEKLNAVLKVVEMQRDVLVAEAKSEHTITATWRPIIMLICGAILANNWIIAPYASAIFGMDLYLPIPPEMWKLLYIGMGGYIVGRSGEKIFREISAAKGK